MQVQCGNCRSNATTGCSLCRAGVYCFGCNTCSNAHCEQQRTASEISFFTSAPSMREYEPLLEKQLRQTVLHITEDKEPSRKRKRETPQVSSPKVPRHGRDISQGRNAATLRLAPIDVSVISWNINHFNKAETKLEVLRWLFEKHPWLDVVVLQEVNEAGRALLEPMLGQLTGIGYELGPTMRGLSASEDGPQDPGDGTRSTINVAGQSFDIERFPRVKSFKIKIKDPKTGQDTWIWMRPNQPEYYPILYRTSTIAVNRYWATYDGATELTTQMNYWAKKPYVGWIADLKWPPRARAFTKKTVTGVITQHFGSMDSVVLGRQSYSGKAGFTKKPFTRDGDEYQIRMSDDKQQSLSLHGSTHVIPASCRPAIVYKIEVKAGPRNPLPAKARIAVIHTTPAGSKFNRAGELVQVRQLFAHMGSSADYWIAAGDYYLDPESKVQDSNDGSRIAELFRSVLDQHGLKAVIAVSATNQSHIRNFTANQLRDQVQHYYTNQEGQRIEKRVVNKRADFLVVTPNFTFTFGGIVCPRGGLLPVDPNHKALDWWSTISDHAPVGGILCSGDRIASRRYYCHSIVHELDQDQSKLEDLYSQVAYIHRRAAEALSAAQSDLLSFLDGIDRRVDTRPWHDTASSQAREQGMTSFSLRPSEELKRRDFPMRGLLASLALLIDSVLADPYVQQFGAVRPYFDQRLMMDMTRGCTSEMVVDWMRYWSTMPREVVAQMTNEVVAPVVRLSRSVMEHLRALNVSEGDFDLTDEDPGYSDSAEIDVSAYLNQAPEEESEDSEEEQEV